MRRVGLWLSHAAHTHSLRHWRHSAASLCPGPGASLGSLCATALGGPHPPLLLGVHYGPVGEDLSVLAHDDRPIKGGNVSQEGTRRALHRPGTKTLV